jgi:hypothetical protein
MFNCEYCGEPSQPGEKAKKVVIEAKKKVYPGGHIGYETIKEITVCTKCHRILAERKEKHGAQT